MIKMKKRILLGLVIILSLISISAVCASENATDLEIADDDSNPLTIDEVDESSDSDDSEPTIDDSADVGNDSSDVDDNQPVIQNSTISASNVVGYETFSTKFVYDKISVINKRKELAMFPSNFASGITNPTSIRPQLSPLVSFLGYLTARVLFSSLYNSLTTRSC